MRRAASAVGSLLALLLAAGLFFGSSIWVAAAALAAAAALGTAGLLGRLPLARAGVFLVGSLLGLAAWSGVSVAWSVTPDRSWDELNRLLVYAAFALLGVVLGSLGPRACRIAALALGACPRRGDPLGARGQGDPRALPGRRARRPAARPDRLLERAGAGGRRTARPRALARVGPRVAARAPGRGRSPRLRGRRRGAPRRLAHRPDRGCRRGRALAAPLGRAGRAGAARARGLCPCRPPLGLGLHPARARRGRAGARRTGLGRRLVRRALPRRRRCWSRPPPSGSTRSASPPRRAFSPAACSPEAPLSRSRSPPSRCSSSPTRPAARASSRPRGSGTRA